MLFVPWAMVVLLIGVFSAAGPVKAAWRTLETENFYIHYDDSLTSLAREIALEAEKVHDVVVTVLQHRPAQKTHIVLHVTGAFNAYASTLLYPTIGIQVAFPTQSEAYIGGFTYDIPNLLRLVLLHEYVHIVHLEMRPEVAEQMMRIFGRLPYLTSPIALAAPFYVEGFAVLFETELTAGRGESSYYRMFLRTAVRDEAVPELDQVMARYNLRGWHPTGNVYLYGYSFLRWLRDGYGDDVFAVINREVALRPDALGHAVEEATELPFDQQWWRWRRDIFLRYVDELEAIRKEPVSPVHVLETVGVLALMPEPSPDGRTVAFLAGGDVAWALRLIDRESGREQHVANVSGLASGRLAWHPGGGHVVVARMGDAPSSVTHLVEVDVATGRVRELRGTEHGHSPAYAPDGRLLAFIRRNGWQTELHVLDRTDGSVRRLDLPEGVYPVDLAWSPAGDALAVAYWRQGVGGGLALYDVGTGNWRELASGYTFGGVSWSPDGRHLLFHSDATGVFNLYRLDLASARSERMTNTETGLFHPRLLAGDRWLAMEYSSAGYRLVEVEVSPYVEVDLHRSRDFDAGSGERSVMGPDAVEAVDRPYSPLPTLRPAFWWPQVTDGPGGTYIGAFTFGNDVLAHWYSRAELMWNYRTGDLRYRFELERHFDGPGISIYAGLENGWVPLGSNAWVDRTNVLLVMSHQRSDRETSRRIWAEIARTHDRPLTGGVEAIRHFLGVGWAYSRAGGVLGLNHFRRMQLTVAAPFEDLRDWRLTFLHLDRIMGVASGRSFDVQFALGWAGKSNVFRLGGETGNFALRGFDYGAAQGSFALRLTGEGRIPLWIWERGIADRPLFFRDLSLHPFGEVGYAVETGSGSPIGTGLISVGAELGLRVVAGYGLSEADWRVGVAHGVGEEGVRFYFRIGTAF